MRLRLILSFALIVLISVAAVVVIARQGTEQEVRAFMTRSGMVETEALTAMLADYYRANGTWEGVASLLPGAGHGTMMGGGRGWQGGRNSDNPNRQGPGMMGGMGGMMNQRLRLTDTQWNIVYDSSSGAPSGQITGDERDQALPIAVEGQVVGYLLPEGGLVYDQTQERFLLGRLNRAALTAAGVGGALSLLLALLLTYHLLRPVNELTKAARRLGSGDLSSRVTVRGTDELAVLGSSFNQMADSLQQAEASRQAITADIAHELRNPLAVQRAHLEALQDGIYPLTAENLDPILEQNHLLTRLVEDLRTLALADSGQLRLERAPTDLAGLVARTMERFSPQAAAQGVELSFEAADGPLPPLVLDALRVEQILGNLLSNALRYTPQGGRITVSLHRPDKTGTPGQPGKVQIQVQDTGPGIPPEALPHIFERFYRVDKARSRAEGGTGLGLSIARQLAEAHGGSLAAANHPDGGAVFTLTLPGGSHDRQ